ncbi:MAG: oligopeptide transporter, OPT family [Planctomycetes bacterium]|nr:oligopeptide transporter, OPT family [Planctomycetota bacterium]
MSDQPVHQPLVAAHEDQPELTFRAVLLGALLGIVFGAASTYLALRVGLTVSASVPIAVIAIAVLRARSGKRAILEHNITQTTGSAGESVAAAVVFTVPALILLGYPLEIGLTTLIAATGGTLGVLMMVPLRRYLIVKEHGKLRYPEGKACAEILRVGELGGTSARKVFVGMGIGVLFQSLKAVFGAIKGTVAVTLDKLFGNKVAYFGKTELACDFDPALVGVGYIIGYRTSLIMVAGSLLATLILIPMVFTFGQAIPGTFGTATKPIAEMSAFDIWKNYVRHIGAGAVAMGGIFALVRALPAIVSALTQSAKGLFGGDAGRGNLRTDRDTPLPVLLLGAVGLVAMVALVPAFQVDWLGAVMILVFGFLFAVVSSRVTGEVGSTSNPLSGMTIAVLMGTCGLFVAAGMGDGKYAVLALMIGAIVCIAISNAGTCSQDLKTGFLVGATPVRQQGALVIGVLASVLAIGWTAYGLNLAETKETPLAQPFAVKAELLENRGQIQSRYEELRAGQAGAPAPRSYVFVKIDKADLPADQKLEPGNYLVDPATNQAIYRREDGIGSGRLQAPQATLMATVIDGILTQKLPWDLILIGVAISLFIELMGFRALTFAVGVYLPLASTMPVFLGGLVRKFADKRYQREPDAEDEPQGVLWCSGLIAGASILGILAAMQAFLPGFVSDIGLHGSLGFLRHLPFGAANENDTGGNESPMSDLFGFGMIVLLGWLMFRAARGGAPGNHGKV